jgi:acyl carrier protein
VEIDQIRAEVLTTIESIAPDTDLRRIKPDRPLRHQIELDSLDWLNVIAGLHDRFSIDIPEADYGQLTSLDVIVAYIASRQAEPAGRKLPPAAPPASIPTRHHVINGTAVTVRPICSDDLALEADFVRHLSRQSRYERFMVTLNELAPAKLSYLTDVDQVRHVALVATVDRDGQEILVGVVRYVVDGAGTGCEFAVAIADDWQRSGLAGILMHTLIRIARSRGLATMDGIVLAVNARMLKFTRQLGFRQQHEPDDWSTMHVVRAL